ncbi:hypothetical protein AVEN_145674-1 [Araneus ventricosus]|uniref:Uncharacterized protein n=1 Tax=Araneus ventricosus TaxID=182803 RepID=A0A4Y2SBQ2_ARAVE|nr:hypothetical protein AVEN_145674-1 [Araneus ventricosus]
MQRKHYVIGVINLLRVSSIYDISQGKKDNQKMDSLICWKPNGPESNHGMGEKNQTPQANMPKQKKQEENIAMYNNLATKQPTRKW